MIYKIQVIQVNLNHICISTFFEQQNSNKIPLVFKYSNPYKYPILVYLELTEINEKIPERFGQNQEFPCGAQHQTLTLPLPYAQTTPHKAVPQRIALEKPGTPASYISKTSAILFLSPVRLVFPFSVRGT
jgi:hypothetical protein